MSEQQTRAPDGFVGDITDNVPTALISGVWVFNDTIVITEVLGNLEEVVVNYTSYHSRDEIENYSFDFLEFVEGGHMAYGQKKRCLFYWRGLG